MLVELQTPLDKTLVVEVKRLLLWAPGGSDAYVVEECEHGRV